MPKIALASDCDDTLYFRNRQPRIQPGDLRAIADFRRKGGIFGICTGRPYYGVLEAVENLVDFDFHICTSGAHLLDKNGNVLEKHLLPSDLVKKLWELGKTTSFMVVHANGRLYSPRPTSSFQIFTRTLEDIPPGSEFFGVSVYTETPEKAAAMAASVNAEWQGCANAFHNQICMDVVAHDASKGTALLQMKKNMGISLMAAIGDSYNDLSMLQAADISFAFPYSPAEVQSSAAYIVPTVEEAL